MRVGFGTRHPSTRKNDASYKHSEERLCQSVPLSTGYFREFVLMKSQWFSSPALHGIMTQCYFSKIPKTCTYFVTCDCEAVETTQVSPPSAAAGPTPHIFETWLHSFWVTSLYTCPLHLTHFNHQMTCHSHYTRESPAWCSGRTSAPTGQQGYGGRLLPSKSF